MTAIVTTKAEYELNTSVCNPDFLSISGSRLYGTDKDSSDWDYRGFVIPPFEYLIGIKQFHDTMVGQDDHKIYSVKRFLDLILKGDPQLTELLFIPREEKYTLELTDIGRRVLGLRPYLISNRVYNRIMGYSYSEVRKACGERLEVSDRTKTEDDVINDIRNIFAPDKEHMDELINILMLQKSRKLVSTIKGLGKKRKKEFKDYGYGVSSAAHSVRLVQQLEELISTGHITFPRPNADILLDIRTGKIDKDEFLKIYDDSKSKAEMAKNVSILPDRPNEKQVWNIYTQIVAKFIANDFRFQNSI
tara:strand:- start:1327 stop:2238 length:912 start_codon:yes stop_codon:yes gene_type:complete